MTWFMKSGDMQLTHRTIPVLGLLALASLSLPAPATAAPTRPIRFDHLSLE